ncbi:hypothetical protein [Staphylococcus felis]|uniref:hypothetical protein n=1 Tax=Staphylococcus felis TaxID=46127 RepID=UPI0021CE2C09|nr:hypothetical protein [Staphylococcus felis]UXR86192.1 hypothetical protein MUA17_09045 [Staphylococcus felis]UXR87114.1 hypothetical protein MUA17_01985 [Staphylococcus felis]
MCRELSNNKRVTYKFNTASKTPTEIQHELENKGVKGFVVKVNYNDVTMLINKCDAKKNREMIK